MKRDIKFRAWEQNIKIMAYPSENLAMSGNEGYSHLKQSFNIDNRKISLASEGWDVEHEGMLPCILMQFTGLKDKNGKEIYEGDIIINKFNNIYGGEIHKEVVKYNNGYHFQNGGATTSNQTIEIIGNIYENPELI